MKLKLQHGKMTKNQVVEYCLSKTAIHEAGHAVAAIKMGIPFVQARIWERRVSSFETWNPIGGEVRLFSKAKKFRDAVVGYAGIVAEELMMDADANPMDIFYDVELLAPSPADLRSILAIHTSWRLRALIRAFEILRACWSDVLLVKATLIQNLKFPQLGRRREGKMLVSIETLEALK